MKQTNIPGTERIRDEKLSKAAEELFGFRTERMEIEKKEREAHAHLLDVMQRKELEVYIDEDLEIRATIKHGEDRVKVQKIKSDNGADEPEGNSDGG